MNLRENREMTQAELVTDRLLLRPFRMTDASQVQILAGDKAVSDMTANIPYPYEDGMAEHWIASHPARLMTGDAIVYAITIKSCDQLIGCMSLQGLSTETPELGYWIGKEYWGAGYCTEACQVFIEYCLESIKAHSIFARAILHNSASMNVLLKCGFEFVNNGREKIGLMEKEVDFKLFRLSLPCYRGVVNESN